MELKEITSGAKRDRRYRDGHHGRMRYLMTASSVICGEPHPEARPAVLKTQSWNVRNRPRPGGLVSRGRRADGLLAAQVIAHPNHGRRNYIAAKLIGKAIHKVYIELWADIDVLSEEELNPHSDVLLEMAGRPNW